jgi:hypothetical protein
VHNLLDDFSWTKGKHTFQFGGNIGLARNPRLSFEHSFSVGKGATNWMAPVGFANTRTVNSPGSPLDPFYGGFPEPASSRSREAELRTQLVRVLRPRLLAYKSRI